MFEGKCEVMIIAAFFVCLVYYFGNALVGRHPVETQGRAFYIFMETFANHITFQLKKNLH